MIGSAVDRTERSTAQGIREGFLNRLTGSGDGQELLLGNYFREQDRVEVRPVAKRQRPQNPAELGSKIAKLDHAMDDNTLRTGV